jgi:Trypsin-like peptidase domain
MSEGSGCVDATPVCISGRTDAALVDVPGSSATPVSVGRDPVPGDLVTMGGFAGGTYQEFHGRVTDVGPAPADNGVVPTGTMVVEVEGEGGPGESGGPAWINGAVCGHVVGGNPGTGLVYLVPISEILPELRGVQATPAPVDERELAPLAPAVSTVRTYSSATSEVPAAVQQAAAQVVKLNGLVKGGSAWPIAQDGDRTTYVSCAHCVSGQSLLTFIDGRHATVLASDAEHDIAAAQVSGGGGVLPCAAQDAEVGSRGWILGFPVTELEERLGGGFLPRRFTITPVTVTGYDHIAGHDLMQLDGCSRGGNSGGPILNDAGEVIGLYTSHDPVTGEGGAVPISQVRQSLGLTPASAALPMPSGAVAAAVPAPVAVVDERPVQVVSVAPGFGVGVGALVPIAEMGCFSAPVEREHPPLAEPSPPSPPDPPSPSEPSRGPEVAP